MRRPGSSAAKPRDPRLRRPAGDRRAAGSRAAIRSITGGALPAARRRGDRRHAASRRPPRRCASSRACTRASGAPAATSAPRPASSRQADGGIDGVAWRARRPPPSSTTARPTARASIACTKPARAPARGDDDRRRRQARARLGEESAGPPSAATMRSNLSAAAPLSSARSQRGARRGEVGGQAARDERFGGERQRHLVQPRVAAGAGEVIDGVEDFERIAGGAGERFVHVGDQRNRRHAGAGRDAAMLCASSRAASSDAMKAPEPHLHVHDQRLQPRRQLLGEDRGGDQRDRLDRRRDVADRVEALVGGRERRRLADDRAADLAHDLAEQRVVGLRDIAGDRIRACRACRRYGRGRARKSSAHRRRRPPASARASGSHCRRRRRSNACRRPGRAGGLAHSSVSPERIMARVRSTRSSMSMPRKNTAMAKAATWPFVTRPSVIPRTKSSISCAREPRAVALGADDLLRQHQGALMRRNEGAQQSGGIAPSRARRIPASPRGSDRRRKARRRNW